ncbi:hypothetical protein Tco_0695819, partial [Tanacetum coccineum]
MPLGDDVLPAEEQLLPAAASPTTDSPGYIPKSDPEEDDDEDPEEDPTDYPTDRDDDEEEDEPFGYEADDEDEDDKEEEHPALSDSVPPPQYIVLQLGYPSQLRHLYHSSLRKRLR